MLRVKYMIEKRIAWAITGAGHALEECVDMALTFNQIDVFLSRAAEEVIAATRTVHAFACVRHSALTPSTAPRRAGKSSLPWFQDVDPPSSSF